MGWSYEDAVRQQQQATATVLSRSRESPIYQKQNVEIFGLSSYLGNRNLFANLQSQQLKSNDERSNLASALSGASGGSGSEAARQNEAKYIGAKMVEPPKPPSSPKSNAPKKPTFDYVDPREGYPNGLGGIAGWNKDYATAIHDISYGSESRGRRTLQNLRGQVGGSFTPEELDETGRIQQANFQTNLSLYDKDYDTWQDSVADWGILNKAYLADAGKSAAYNKDFNKKQAALQEGSEAAVESAAASGKRGVGGSGAAQGIGQGVNQSSPGLAFIDRPDTIWT